MKKLVIEREYFRYKIITSDKRTNTKAHARISSLVHSDEPFKKLSNKIRPWYNLSGTKLPSKELERDVKDIGIS